MAEILADQKVGNVGPAAAAMAVNTEHNSHNLP